MDEPASKGVRAEPGASELPVRSGGHGSDARFARAVLTVLVSLQILWIGALVLGVSWLVAVL